MLKVGSFVYWAGCPHAQFARNQITQIEGDKAKLRFYWSFHPMSEMVEIEPTDLERKLCEAYHLPIANSPEPN